MLAAQGPAQRAASDSLCLFLQPEKDSLPTSVIFLHKHINFLSQLSGDDPWICDTSSNNIFFFYGDFFWVGLDRRNSEATSVQKTAVFGLKMNEITMCYSAATDGQVTTKQARLMLEEAIQKESWGVRSRVSGLGSVLDKVTGACSRPSIQLSLLLTAGDSGTPESGGWYST